MSKESNVFDVFGVKPSKQQDPTIQTLYDYEEHYMKLIKSYRHEIEFINQLHTQHEQEVKNFYQNDLPAIQEKLSGEPIDDEVRREWIKHLERHISKSFEMSEHFINVLTTKKVEEFNAAIREKVLGGNI
ncbi:MAG: hypothetical protein IJ563_07580 [Selenomonadaceae bacterium]|nr:hypothetical protein [Selenomonadaceae bacterium]